MMLSCSNRNIQPATQFYNFRMRIVFMLTSFRIILAMMRHAHESKILFLRICRILIQMSNLAEFYFKIAMKMIANRASPGTLC